ncbi:MAG TPA: hypothetical protein VK102_07935 [Sphingobacterium sp.]|nr:hypothetical protein [Sphingobacterium sp.]
MENIRTDLDRSPKRNDNYANKTSHYSVLAVVILIGAVGGVFLRFVPEIITSLDQMQFGFSLVSNILLIVTAFIAIRIVFNVMGFGKQSN